VSGRRGIVSAIVAGCGAMPHVGAHPGTGIVLFLIVITGAAGAQAGSWAGFVGGLGLAVAIYGPLYLYGAYERTRLSERLSASHDGRRG
jgi:hypothetical protein